METNQTVSLTPEQKLIFIDQRLQQALLDLDNLDSEEEKQKRENRFLLEKLGG